MFVVSERRSNVAEGYPVLRAAAVGGFWGGMISCTFLGWWGVLLALALFVGCAVTAGIHSASRQT